MSVLQNTITVMAILGLSLTGMLLLDKHEYAIAVWNFSVCFWLAIRFSLENGR